ncbi:MAG: tRNA (adenosine(37)-N6)-threonylcarbamoyltransferase complex ATPase subunit type 1 TsaE [Candidatus Sumerlaeales bacterium]|nr:tRNA (adenosine(37)-N6)-threonylcarbamoyltransferase complex ATPase subunit type 1 TsaE [Candidatus Sumerlaeales bacterium]
MMGDVDGGQEPVKIVLHMHAPEGTVQLAQMFSDILRCGDVVSLEGDLGAGKTFFTGAVARALGTRDTVTSPTFVLQKIYDLHCERADAPQRLAHYDTYRLMDYGEMVDFGFEEMTADSVSFVEWGDRFLGDYPGVVLRVCFEIIDRDSRKITLLLPPDRAEEFADAGRHNHKHCH